MSLFGRLKNIFTSNSNSSNDSKRRQKHSFINFDADPNEFWDIVGELGDGAFGKVYKTRHKTKQILAALKQVDINEETELDDYSVEIDILNQCRHKNIVGMYEAYFFGGKLWMFIEFCGGGALDSIMLELEKPLTEPQIRYVCREMCEAIEFLHQNFVIHRDLKAGNVLLTGEGEVKLADFGVSARNNSYRQRRDTFIGTPYWMAPEVILCETLKDSPYDFKADIWSFGITLIEFAQIEPPNSEMHPMRVLVKIQKSDPPTLKYPSKWSKEFNDFITKCLVKDPDQRPTAGDLLQHPFIRNVKGNEAIMELISEANAEIILEEKDIDEDMDETVYLEANHPTPPADADSDSVSTASESNVPKPGEADDNSISDKSPAVVVDKTSVPAIMISEGGAGEPVTTGEPTKEQLVAAGDNKRTSTSSDIASPDNEEPVVIRKKRPAAEEQAEDEEPVVLRKKKPPVEEQTEKTSNTEERSTGQKKYRTLTKTRKFVVNGEVVMSKVSKIVPAGSVTDKKQQEHQLWKADLRELQMLHKQERKVLQDLQIKSLAAIDEQTRKFDQDNTILVKNAENSLEQMAKQHKQQMDKMLVNHNNELKNLQKKTKQEQDKDFKAFSEGLKQDMKLLKQEVDLLPKDTRKDIFTQRKKEKEAEHAEKERKFLELQKENMERVLKRAGDQQKDQIALCERQFLQLRQQATRTKETSLWEAEEQQLKDRYELNKRHLELKFITKKQLMMKRHNKELEQVCRINTSKEDELLQCHLLELKRLPKFMKNQSKTRALMFKESLRISVIGITAEQEKERIKQFEESEKFRLKEEETRLKKKHKRQIEELKTKNEAIVRELEQVQAEKRKMLEDNEEQKMNELLEQLNVSLDNIKIAQHPKKEAMEALFAKEVVELEKSFSNGSSVDQGSCKSVLSGVAMMTSPRNSQVPADFDVKSQAKVSPGGPKKLQVSATTGHETQSTVTSGTPVAASKIDHQAKSTSSVDSKVPVEKHEKQAVCAKVQQETHTAGVKVHEEIQASDIKTHEEKLTAGVKAAEEKLAAVTVQEEKQVADVKLQEKQAAGVKIQEEKQSTHVKVHEEKPVTGINVQVQKQATDVKVQEVTPVTGVNVQVQNQATYVKVPEGKLATDVKAQEETPVTGVDVQVQKQATDVKVPEGKLVTDIKVQEETPVTGVNIQEQQQAPDVKVPEGKLTIDVQEEKQSTDVEVQEGKLATEFKTHEKKREVDVKVSEEKQAPDGQIQEDKLIIPVDAEDEFLLVATQANEVPINNIDTTDATSSVSTLQANEDKLSVTHSQTELSNETLLTVTLPGSSVSESDACISSSNVIISSLPDSSLVHPELGATASCSTLEPVADMEVITVDKNLPLEHERAATFSQSSFPTENETSFTKSAVSEVSSIDVLKDVKHYDEAKEVFNAYCLTETLEEEKPSPEECLAPSLPTCVATVEVQDESLVQSAVTGGVCTVSQDLQKLSLVDPQHEQSLVEDVATDTSQPIVELSCIASGEPIRDHGDIEFGKFDELSDSSSHHLEMINISHDSHQENGGATEGSYSGHHQLNESLDTHHERSEPFCEISENAQERGDIQHDKIESLQSDVLCEKNGAGGSGDTLDHESIALAGENSLPQVIQTKSATDEENKMPKEEMKPMTNDLSDGKEKAVPEKEMKPEMDDLTDDEESEVPYECSDLLDEPEDSPLDTDEIILESSDVTDHTENKSSVA